MTNKLDRQIIFVYPSHIDIAGSIPAGFLLSQIFFLSEKKESGEFYKTDEEFCNELRMGLDQLTRAKNKLKQLGLISITRKGIPAKSYYKLNMGKYLECMKGNS